MKTTSLLIAFIPIALITGQFISGLFAVIIGIYYLFGIFKNKTFDFYKEKLIFTLILFNIYILIRSLFVDNIYLSLESSLFFFRYIFFALGIAYILQNNDFNFFLKSAIIIFIAIFAFFFFDVSYQSIFGLNIFNIEPLVTGRHTSIFGEEMILGNFIVRLSPIFIYFISLKVQNHTKKFFLTSIVVFLALFLTLMSGERVAIFYSILLLLFHFLYFKGFTYYRIITFTLATFIAITLVTMNSNIKDRIVNTTIKNLESANNQFYFFSRQHHSHYITSIRMFMDNPIFGQGPRQFRNLCSDQRFYYDRYSCSTHPHNTYIQLLAETGIIGFLFFFSIFILFFFKFIKKLCQYFFFNDNYDEKLYLYFGIIIWLWPLAPSFNFFGNWINVINYMYIGFILLDHQLKKI